MKTLKYITLCHKCKNYKCHCRRCHEAGDVTVSARCYDIRDTACMFNATSSCISCHSFREE